jgi:hypothetical protein
MIKAEQLLTAFSSSWQVALKIIFWITGNKNYPNFAE